MLNTVKQIFYLLRVSLSQKLLLQQYALKSILCILFSCVLSLGHISHLTWIPACMSYFLIVQSVSLKYCLSNLRKTKDRSVEWIRTSSLNDASFCLRYMVHSYQHFTKLQVANLHHLSCGNITQCMYMVEQLT